MMGSDSEQIIPRRACGDWHGPMPPTSRFLWKGHGSTDSTRSMKPRPLARWTWPHNTSDITKAVFLLCLRRPAGVVSKGSAMRIGRAGASLSKKLASWKRLLGALSSAGFSGPQSQRT